MPKRSFELENVLGPIVCQPLGSKFIDELATSRETLHAQEITSNFDSIRPVTDLSIETYLSSASIVIFWRRSNLMSTPCGNEYRLARRLMDDVWIYVVFTC